MSTDAASIAQDPARPVWPMCYAHRGARGHAPENTLLAFELAFDLGADGIECDVQRSSDGQLVIVHDGTLNRTTNGTGPVAAQPFQAMRALDAGVRWRIRQCIPTLDETLDLVRRRGGHLNLELKAESVEEAIGTARVVAPVLGGLDAETSSRVLVSSFHLPAVAEIRRLLPSVRVAGLFANGEWARGQIVPKALELGVEAIHPGWRLASRRLVRQAHDAGLRVNVWTANHPATIRRLLAWGADGIFSDFPERVVILRARAAAQSQTQPVPEH